MRAPAPPILRTPVADVATIIPCLNDVTGLRRAVQSVRRQTVPCHLIIVDDGSDPAEAEEILRIGQNSEADVIRLPVRSGPAAARNAGIEASRARYVAFLDADDVWLPDKLEDQFREMTLRRLGFSYMRYANVTKGRARVMPAPPSLSKRELLGNTAIGCSTVMLCRMFMGSRRFPQAECEDLAFWATLLGERQRAVLVGRDVRVLRAGGGRSRDRVGAASRYWRTLRCTLELPLGEALTRFVPYSARAVAKHWSPLVEVRDLAQFPGTPS